MTKGNKEVEPIDDPIFNLAVIGVGIYIAFVADVLAGLLVAGFGAMNYLNCRKKDKQCQNLRKSI